MLYIECTYNLVLVRSYLIRRRGRDGQDGDGSSKYRKIINYSCDCESTTEEYPVTQMLFLCEKTFHGKCGGRQHGSVRSFSAHIIGTSFMTSIKLWDFYPVPFSTRATYQYPCVLLGHPYPPSAVCVAVICGWFHSSGLSFSSW